MARGGGGSMLSIGRAVRREQFQDEHHDSLTYTKKGETAFLNYGTTQLILLGIESELNCFIEVSKRKNPPKPKSRPTNRLKIEVEKGSLADKKADVLVCTVAGSRKTLKKGCGIVAKAVYEAGGDKLEQAYQAAGIVDFNNIVVTSTSGKLQCSWVVHLGIDKWGKAAESFIQLKNNIRLCLNAANDKGATSIAFPTIGCGRLGYPADDVAQAFLDEYLQFLQDKPDSSLQVVYVVVYDGEHEASFRDTLEDMSIPLQFLRTELSFESSDEEEEEDGGDTTYVHVFGGDTYIVDDACQRIVDYKHKNYREAKVTDKLVPTLTPQEKTEVTKLDDIIVDFAGTTVSLCGNKASVLEAECYLKELLKTKTPSPVPVLPPAPVKVNPEEIKKKKGHKAYVKALQDSTLFLPMVWSKYTGKAAKAAHDFTASEDCLHPVSQDTFTLVEQLVQSTARNDLVGHGRDATGLSYTKLVVKKVQRIENPKTFSNYAHFRQQQVSQARKKAVPGVATVSSADGEVKTRSCAKLNEMLVPEINEFYLFHGSEITNMDTIRHQGLDPRISGSGMFGKGIYFSESSTKADQYTDKKVARHKGEHHMFLARVILGNGFLAPKPCNDFTRPPCTGPGCNKCPCSTHHEIYDSIIGLHKDGSVKLLFREFVVFDKNQCYPEYIITYERQ